LKEADVQTVRVRVGACTYEVSARRVVTSLRAWAAEGRPGAQEALEWLLGQLASRREVIRTVPPLPAGTAVRDVYRRAAGVWVATRQFLRIRCPKCKQDYDRREVKTKKWSGVSKKPDPVRGRRHGYFGYARHCPRGHMLEKWQTGVVG
jgi:hypothetical protein